MRVLNTIWPVGDYSRLLTYMEGIAPCDDLRLRSGERARAHDTNDPPVLGGDSS